MVESWRDCAEHVKLVTKVSRIEGEILILTAIVIGIALKVFGI